MTTQAEMDRLIAEHLTAELAGDSAAAVAVYTGDVEHDVVGWPTGPVSGPAAAKDFYDQLMATFVNDGVTATRTLYGEDHCVVEHRARGTFPRGFLGAPASDRPVEFRMLHVFEFRGGAISRENVWLDGGAIVAQLAAA
ncbi:nuclear transport factor 2 family protein [Actinoplanes sp. NPDC024001]|uniref:nuclear transport factor 2 family protein n=1 Tax=Actinoplanes sp. NPDC024001 TaxID=3154598 RepID=UPI003405D83B